MPINPNIAMSFKPVEIQQADPLRDYAAVAQIQNAQLQNQLARQQMEQEQGVMNYLRATDLSTPEGRAGLRRFGKTGLGYEKLIAEQEANALKRQELEGKLREQRMTALGTGLTSVLQDPSDASLTAAFDRLDATGVDTKPFRKSLLSEPDLSKRQAVITQYVTSNPEGRQALAFVQPKPEKADLNGVTAWIDTNPNSPTYLKQIKSLEDQPLPKAVEEQKVRIAGAGASKTLMNVNTQLPASEEAQKEFMKSSRQSYDMLKTAPALLANIEESKKLVSGAKGFMGPGGETLLKATSFLNSRLGTSIDTKGVSDASELRSRLFAGVIENLRKLDAQPTAGQQQALQDAIGNLGSDPNALPRILDSVADTIRQKVSGYNQEVSDAELRGVKFPYKPQIKLPETPKSAVDQIPGQTRTVAPTAIPKAAIDALRAGRGTDAQFDEIFGPGAAKRVRGGK